MKISNGVKIKFLVLAALTVFLTVGVALAQFDGDGMELDPAQFGITGEKINSLMTAPTGKMTDEIDLEIVARISVCLKGTAMSEEEFKALAAPYDVTGGEFAAYHWQRLRGGEGASQLLEKWAARMPGLVAAAKARGCKFGTEPEPSVPAKCSGSCSVGNVCPANAINKGAVDCRPYRQCHRCGFLGWKKCCEDVPTTCCEYSKPVTDCSGGMCTYDACPGLTQEVGPANCGEAEDCETGWGFRWGLGKYCQKKPTKCCLALDYIKCTGGTCQNSDACPRGFENVGMADCGSYEQEHNCGFFGLAKCKDPAPKTCCLPE